MPEVIKSTQSTMKVSDEKWERIFGKREVKSLIAKPKEKEKNETKSK